MKIANGHHSHIRSNHVKYECNVFHIPVVVAVVLEAAKTAHFQHHQEKVGTPKEQ